MVHRTSLPIESQYSLLLSCLKCQPGSALNDSLAESVLQEEALLKSSLPTWRLFRLLKPFLAHLPTYTRLQQSLDLRVAQAPAP